MSSSKVNMSRQSRILSTTSNIVQIQRNDRRSSIFKFGKKDNLDSFRQELTIDDHCIPLTAVIKRYNTDIVSGLKSIRAAETLKINGPNLLQPPKAQSRCRVFCVYMFGGFSALLWIGCALTLIGYTITKLKEPDTPLDQVYLAIVLFLVICITGLFGFYQESANNAIMESFKKLIPKSAIVIRDGKEQSIPSENVVVGDIVVLYAGDCIPADLRIIDAITLKVDNSSITGESEPQSRTTENTDLNPLETANLAFYGTNAVEGSGRGLVISTGQNTLMGHIATLTAGLQPDETPIKKELTRFIHIITFLAVLIGVIFFILAMCLGYDFFESFVYLIAIVVANVPEGLLVTMTACLTLTAQKMKKKNCLVKNLHAIETLGSTTVICSDKTGTLTQNRMTVSHICYDNNIMDILSPTYTGSSSDTFHTLCRIGILCSRAEFKENQEQKPIYQREVKGDASESAVLKCMEILTGKTKEIREQYPKVFEIPFNSTNKFQISIHIMEQSNNLLLVIKGAPERIFERCSTYSYLGNIANLDETAKRKLIKSLLELGYMGERVLGFAQRILDDSYQPYGFDETNYPTDEYCFIGFMSMIDPPRFGVTDAVSKCKSAGIRVVMVTGDHPITAMAIAKKVGIITEENDTIYDIAMRRNISASKVTEEESSKCLATIITGTDLRGMESSELTNAIEKYDEIVFARTSPQQKLQIVEAFQHVFELVAVTGDGVNDSPALKKADIGVAMGIAGSEVSKEAADMIILDDNFASIVTGIEEGRLIFDNLKKSIAYMLTSNVPEVAPFILHVALGIPNALTVMSILVIDVGTDLWPGISLAYEKPEIDIMDRKPRNPTTDRLVGIKLLCFVNLNVGLLQACAMICCFFNVMADHGWMPDKLIFIRDEWNADINDMVDSYGQEWSLIERKKLERKAVSASFLSIVVTQIADCIICKTRRRSILQHGMGNNVMNCGIVFEILLSLTVVFCPYLNSILGFESIDIFTLWPVFPFAIWLIVFDEVRKYLIRRNPAGWIERETYF